MILRDLETKVYTIDDLKTADVELYFNSLNNTEKSKDRYKRIEVKCCFFIIEKRGVFILFAVSIFFR